MFAPVLGALALVMVLGFTPVAFGQGGVPGPFTSSILTTFKTPPLQNSESFVIPLDFHINVPNPTTFGVVAAGWAGVSIKAHLLDNTELDVVKFSGVNPGSPPFGMLDSPNPFVPT